MKRRMFLILLCIATISIVAAGTLLNREKAKAMPMSVSNTPHTKQKKVDPPGTVDGKVHPEMIPDRVAYMLLFRFISNHQKNENEKKQIREYVRQTGLGRQHNCPESIAPADCSLPNVGVGDNDIDALMAAAAAFQQRVSVLDAQAKDIKDRTWPNPSPEAMAQLTLLQEQKEALADEIIASLPRRLSPGGLQRVVQHINKRLKHLTKRFPGPPSLPNGLGWKDHSPKHRH